jgi:DNA polymerase III subunit epsilon
LILFFDTETTDKYNFKVPVDDPSQPHLVQLAYILASDLGEEYQQYSTLVKPDSRYPLSDKALETHGIDLATSLRDGMPIYDVLKDFWKTSLQASLWVAHNVDFDVAVMRTQFARNKLPCNIGPLSRQFCTMRRSTAICRIASPYNGNEFKWPKLAEAYKHFTGRDLEKAHDALFDVQACKEIYFHILRHEEREMTRITGKTDNVLYKGEQLAESKKAWRVGLFCRDEETVDIWLPKSQVEKFGQPGEETWSIPQWLVDKNEILPPE